MLEEPAARLFFRFLICNQIMLQEVRSPAVVFVKVRPLFRERREIRAGWG